VFTLSLTEPHSLQRRAVERLLTDLFIKKFKEEFAPYFSGNIIYKLVNGDIEENREISCS
jgi:hypothetical protein